ncbi:hypothetical protein PV390_25615 [Streptomyces sp. ME02-6991-2A]|uniref:hypothetical protein n=1 Tax=Streptomyces TaxID=1883 RepID=UPI00299FF21A|nr:hypothetical protein [Streptomyces sp. ME02-6991-2A]MDX3377783.1 hypothetical protein [Streptomyces sp. ME02-6991-2A]
MGDYEISDGQRNEGDEKSAQARAKFMDELRRNVPMQKISQSEDIRELQHYLSIVNSELDFARSDMSREVYKWVRPQIHRRKELISSRLWELTNRRQINSLRETIEIIPDSVSREKVRAELDALEQSSNTFASESRDSISEQYEWERKALLLRQDISERKWNVRAQLLARESVATLVGSLLLVGLAAVITVAMFTNVQVSEILTNSFLIVLGYFFGQNSDKRNAGADS